MWDHQNRHSNYSGSQTNNLIIVLYFWSKLLVCRKKRFFSFVTSAHSIHKTVIWKKHNHKVRFYSFKNYLTAHILFKELWNKKKRPNRPSRENWIKTDDTKEMQLWENLCFTRYIWWSEQSILPHCKIKVSSCHPKPESLPTWHFLLLSLQVMMLSACYKLAEYVSIISDNEET